ncbi:MAG: MBOAT family protein [Bacteroidia bacterium]|nr:MBOAT family protein [Bacteroidia bacterium]
MLFNSLEFLVFFPVVLLLYYLLPHRFRWPLLLVASYYFYMSWNPPYILLIVISTLIDFVAGRQMSQLESKEQRRPWLYLSLLSNLGILITFKYFNFFSGAVTDLIQSTVNPEYTGVVHGLILPMGISFYTFQTMSYSIDIFHGRAKAEKHLGIFALFVSFFPQLVAGPIERAQNLLGQFKMKVNFSYENIVTGLRQAAWGMFKKVVIADRLAVMVDHVYNSPTEFEGISLLLATFFFAFQIFCDFSGYSDIAIGTAKMLGIDLMENFRRPYYSKSIAEFWRRWHISLSTWFRDYVYIPLGGNRVLKWRWYYNLFITFAISGLWHGANWTFLIWGALHGLYLILELVVKYPRKGPRWQDPFKVIWVFGLVCLGWIFFRANSLADALYICQHSITGLGKSISLIQQEPVKHLFLGQGSESLLLSFFFLGAMEFVHLFQRKKGSSYFFGEHPLLLRWAFYTFLMVSMVLFGIYHNQSEFIYFQF